MFSPNTLDKDVAPMYYSYGVTATEVELDVLTGQIQIPRVDILYDCGDRSGRVCVGLKCM